MSLNSPRVVELILENLKMRPGCHLPADEALRTGLRTSIAAGLTTAFTSLKNRGENLVYEILGVDKKFDTYSLSSNSILGTKLREIMTPMAKELAADLLTSVDKSTFKLSKTAQAELIRSMRKEYSYAVEREMREYFKKEIAEKARADVAEMWDHLPVILGDGNTLENVVADHFTSMVAQDSDLKFEQEQKREEYLIRTMHEMMVDDSLLAEYNRIINNKMYDVAC